MQGLEWCIYTLKNAKDCQQTPQVRRGKEENLHVSEGVCPATPYNGELFASRLVKQQINVQSHPVCNTVMAALRNEYVNFPP